VAENSEVNYPKKGESPKLWGIDAKEEERVVGCEADGNGKTRQTCGAGGSKSELVPIGGFRTREEIVKKVSSDHTNA